MSKKTHRRRLNRSCAWIRANLHATNLDVPEEFREQWIFEDEDDEPRPAGFFLSVFAFGYMQYELLTGSAPASEPRSVAIEHLIEFFTRWQLKLALAEIHHKTDVQVEPMPLFGFPIGETVRYRPRRSEVAAN